MKKGFTLIELLVVIGIMGLLGTAAVGGYRQMQRGMEEKGVMQNVNTFIRAAYQRAQIDRQPTAVVFWNETLRGDSDDDDESAIVVGRAVAVRRFGRITKKSGNVLLDEFADLELSYQTEDEDGMGGTSKATMYLYPMDDLNEVKSTDKILRSLVETKVYGISENPIFLSGLTKTEQMASGAASGESSGELTIYGFKLRDENNVDWKRGKAYGLEFAHIELPHGYIFGSGSYESSAGSPIKSAGSIVFNVARNSGNGISIGSLEGIEGRDSIPIYALRPDAAGTLKPVKIGDTARPTNRIK